MAKNYENIVNIAKMLSEGTVSELSKKVSAAERTAADILKKLSELEAARLAEKRAEEERRAREAAEQEQAAKAIEATPAPEKQTVEENKTAAEENKEKPGEAVEEVKRPPLPKLQHPKNLRQRNSLNPKDLRISFRRLLPCPLKLLSIKIAACATEVRALRTVSNRAAVLPQEQNTSLLRRSLQNRVKISDRIKRSKALKRRTWTETDTRFPSVRSPANKVQALKISTRIRAVTESSG